MTQVSRGNRPGVALPVRIHDLLLGLAGRVDDDALADARQMLASAELDRSLEFVAGCLVAGGVVLSGAQHRELESLFADTYLDPAVIDRVVVRDPAPAGRHRFAVGPVDGREPDRGVADAVRPVLDVLPDVRSVWCVWRLTPAGPVSGPVPHRVVLVGVGPGGFAPATAYRVEYALRRAGIRGSVEVLVDGNQPTDYHQEAMRCARQVPFVETDGGQPPMAAVEPVRSETFDPQRSEASARPFGGEPRFGGPPGFAEPPARPEPAETRIMTPPVGLPLAESAPVDLPPAEPARPLPPPVGLHSAEPAAERVLPPPVELRGVEPERPLPPPVALPAPAGLHSPEPAPVELRGVEPERPLPPAVGLHSAEPAAERVLPPPVELREPVAEAPRPLPPQDEPPRDELAAETRIMTPPVELWQADEVDRPARTLPPSIELPRAEDQPPTPFAQERVPDEEPRDKPADLPRSALSIETPTNSRPAPRRRGRPKDEPSRPRLVPAEPPAGPDNHSAALVDDILNTQERNLLKELQDELARREQQEQGSTSSGPWGLDRAGRHGKAFDSARVSGPTLVNGVPPHPEGRNGYPPAN